MPRIDHPDLGDIINSQYRTATIVSVDASLDTAEITSPLGNFTAVPIFYHCEPDPTVRSNGALEGGGAPFAASDEVVVLFQPNAAGNPEAKYVVGFADGIRPCCLFTETWGSTLTVNYPWTVTRTYYEPSEPPVPATDSPEDFYTVSPDSLDIQPVIMGSDHGSGGYCDQDFEVLFDPLSSGASDTLQLITYVDRVKLDVPFGVSVKRTDDSWLDLSWDTWSTERFNIQLTEYLADGVKGIRLRSRMALQFPSANLIIISKVEICPYNY